YERLVEENRRRGKDQPEFELLDTGLLDEDRYFDVFVEYAKAGPNDLLMQVTAHNRGPDDAVLHLLPQLWFRNTWSWQAGAVNPRQTGTKAAAHDLRTVPARGQGRVRLRLVDRSPPDPFGGFEAVIGQRRKEADEFYAGLQADIPDADARNVQRQALAGLV